MPSRRLLIRNPDGMIIYGHLDRLDLHIYLKRKTAIFVAYFEILKKLSRELFSTLFLPIAY
jgi:hypothetical protein